MSTIGISFQDLLRRRRELPLAEVVRLCGTLPRLLDERQRRQAPGAVFLADVFVTVPGGDPEKQRLLETPVHRWPSFTVSLAEPEPENLERTVLTTRVDNQGGHEPIPLARLLYELLGGKVRSSVAAQRPPPLPALNEDGNNLLRRALSSEAERESYASFWQRWLRACEVAAQVSRWRIPRWLLSVAHSGTMLNLTPSDERELPLALISRPFFRIGRSRSTSDYPTRITDRSGVLDEERTVQLSRVQVIAEWGGSGLTLRDGNGTKPSANGTLWNGQPLPWATPTPFSVSGELMLGDTYRLSLQVATAPAQPPEIENLREWATPSGPLLEPSDFAAVTFRPPEGQFATREAVWVGRGIGFHLGRDRLITWDVTGARSPAQFVFAHGCFWLANTSLEDKPPLLNEATLGPGQIAPLASEQTLELGGRRYAVTVGM